MSEIPNVKVLPAYKDFLQESRFKVAYGGRGSAKTRTFTSLLVERVLMYGQRVACFREIMKSLEDSVYQEIVSEIDQRGLGQYFKELRSEIYCTASGGIFRFDGLHRNKSKVKGYSNFDVAWIEEAETVTQESWDYLIPTIRKSHSEIWVTYNPESINSSTHRKFVSAREYPEEKDGKPYCIVRKINYDQNPFFPEELRVDMELMKERDYERYRHVYLGEPVPDSERAIIKSVWVEAAINAHQKLNIEPTGERQISLDVADEGKDKNAICDSYGILVKNVFSWSGKNDDIMGTTQKALDYCFDNKIKEMRFDADGLGAGVRGDSRAILERTRWNIDVIPFRGSSGVMYPERQMVEGRKNKDFFSNRKAQAWWMLRLRFQETYRAINGEKSFDLDNIIALDGSIKDIDSIICELCQPTWSQNALGKIVVDKQPGGTLSPNLADSIMMAYAPVKTGFF